MVDNEKRIRVITEFLYTDKGGLTRTTEHFKSIANGQEKIRKVVSENINGFEIFRKEVTDTHEAVNKFQFGWLGVMFFAMQVQRIFGQVLMAGVNTFRRLTEQGEGFGSALTAISAETDFLKFSLGAILNETLEPLLPLITDFVTTITDFVSQHPEIAIGLVAGYFGAMAAFNYAQVMLFINSLSALGTASLLSKVGVPLLVVGAGIALLVILGDRLKPTWDVVGQVFDKIKDILHKIGIDLPDVNRGLDILAYIINSTLAPALRTLLWVLTQISEFLDILKSVGQMVTGPLASFFPKAAPANVSAPPIPNISAPTGYVPSYPTGQANQTSVGDIKITINTTGMIDEKELARVIGDEIARSVSNVTNSTSRYG